MRWVSQTFNKARRLILPGLSVLLGFSWLLPVAAAGNARLYISPNAGSVQVGQTIVLSLRVDSGGQSMTAVEAYGTYDASKLELTSIDTSASPFDMSVESSGNAGSFRIVRVALNDTSGDVLIARLGFKAIAAGGSEVALADSSKLSDPEGELFTLERGSSTVTVTPSSSGNSVGGTNQGSSGGSSTAAPAAPGHGMSVAPLYVGYTLVSFDITTSKPTSASIEYGTDANNLEFSSNSAQSSATAHTLSFKEELIRPATTYFYRVTTVASSGSKAVSSVESVTTQGLRLFVQIVDANDQPVKASMEVVETGEKLATTENGQLTLENLTDGLITLRIDTGWRSSEHRVEPKTEQIKNESKDQQGRTVIEQTLTTQSETIRLDYVPIKFTAATIARLAAYALAGLIVVLILIRIAVVVYYRSHAARRVEAEQTPTLIKPTQNPPAQSPGSSDDWWRRGS